MSQTWVLDAGTSTLLQYQDELRCYYRLRVKDTFDAEDLVGQTWLVAGRVYEGRSSLRHFLFCVARRMVFSYWRRAGRRPWFEADVDEPDLQLDYGESPSAALARTALADRVDAALAELPRHYGEVVELVLRGHGHVAIAEQLGIDYNTVRSRYSRGKARLLELLRVGE